MSVTIRFNGDTTATVDGSTWTCSDEDYLVLLRTITHGAFGPSGSDPNPDHTLARKAAKMLDGTVIEVKARPGDAHVPADAIF